MGRNFCLDSRREYIFLDEEKNKQNEISQFSTSQTLWAVSSAKLLF